MKSHCLLIIHFTIKEKYNNVENIPAETVDRFVVRSLEKHLNYIDLFKFKSIMIQNLFIDNLKLKV